MDGLLVGKLIGKRIDDPIKLENWYFEDYTNTMMKEYKGYIEELGGDTLRAMNKIKEEHIEASDKFLSKIFS